MIINEDGYKKKKNLILDLDETLINALSEEEQSMVRDFDERKNLFKYTNMDSYYSVFHRPGLQKFLKYIFKNFNVSIYTAASKDYALFIIEHIILRNKKKRKLDYIFFSYHCDLSKKLKNGIKDLSILWDIYNLEGYNKNNTIIIDDNPDVKKTGYCIQVPEFNFSDRDSENDDYLSKLRHMLEEYKNLPDDHEYIQ